MEAVKIVESCLSPGKGEKRGLMRVEPNYKEARKHLGKAEDNLRAMELLYRNEFHDWTVVVGYYAMYHAVLALLRNIGLLALTHKCALNAFNLFFIQKGKIEPKFVEYFERAKKLERKYVETIERASAQRVFVQYRVIELSGRDVEWVLQAAREFVEKIMEMVIV